MAYHQISASSLTPTRPAPQLPLRRETDSPMMYTSNSALSNSGYNAAITFSPSTPSSSSYNSSYSGIGASPTRNNDPSGSQVVRSGPVSIKEDGTFASWIWKLKWLMLKEETLSIHKSEVRCVLVSLYIFSFRFCHTDFSATKRHQVAGHFKH